MSVGPHPIVTLEIRDIYAQMIRNAEALKRLLVLHEDATLDADVNAHFHELLDEIGTREARHTQRIGQMILDAHLERRVRPFERRTNVPERRQTLYTPYPVADHHDTPQR